MNRNWNRADRKLPLLNQSVIGSVVGLGSFRDLMRVENPHDDGSWCWATNTTKNLLSNNVDDYTSLLNASTAMVTYWMMPPHKPN